MSNLPVGRGSWARALDRFFAPQPQHAMVLCRIGFGLILFVSYLQRFPHVQQLYGPQGVGGYDLYQRFPRAVFGLELDAPFHFLHLVASAQVIWLLYGLLILACLAFTVGAWTRTAGVLALVLHSLFVARNQYAYDGWAWMMKPYLLYVLLSSAGRYGGSAADRTAA